VARNTDKTDSYISMVLGLNGRVRPADLQSIAAESRAQALSTFLEAHGAEMELHLAGDELVAGPPPDPDAPVAASAPAASAPAAPAEPSRPADLTADGQSAIDLLLGDYDGVPQAGPEPIADPALDPPLAPGAGMQASSAATPPPTRLGTTGGASVPAADETPRDTARAWMLWWIPTLLLPLVGGSAAWLFLRRKRAFAARAMLTTALVLGLVVSVVWLRYAEQIAAVANQRAADSVIVLPAKGAPDASSTP
jgi:hypothetical protein